MTIRRQLIAAFSLTVLFLIGISCVKEWEENTHIPEQGTRVSLTVNDADWESTRSAFTPGEGIKLTKTEKISLLYDNGSLYVGNASYAIAASPQGAGTYSFTAPEGSLDKTWYGIVPYSYELTRAQFNNRYLLLTFPSIQFPGQNTFDPQTDFLVSKPFMVEGTGARTATIDAFKRLTAPFLLRITGLESGEKIYAVTFALNNKADGTSAFTMAGRCWYTVGATPNDIDFVQVQLAYSRSNSLSAVYDEGLMEEEGCWPVWFNLRPVTIPSSTVVTVTVFTADACYTRTVPINAGTFVTNRINTFSINIKGNGYASEPVVSQAFFQNGMNDATSLTSAASEKTVALTATDGVERNWEMKAYNWTAAKLDGGSLLPNAVGFPKGQDAYIKIPAVENNSITKVRLYLAPASHVENYDFPIEVYDGENVVHTVTSVAMLDLSKGYTAGGIIDIAPGGVSDLTGMTLKFGTTTRNAAALVSRIILYLKAETPPPPDPPLPSISDDYYQDYLDGKDVIVGNRTYNKSTHPSCALVRLSQLLSGSDLAGYLNGTYDIVFLDYLAEDAGQDKLVVSDADFTPADGVALIGRYPEHHSELIFESKRFVPQGSFALRDVCIRSNTWAFYTSGLASSESRFDIEDCAFFIEPASGAQGGLIADNASSAVLGSMTLRNSVVIRRNDFNHGLFSYRSGLYGAVPYKDYVIENNAFIYESAIMGREVCTSNLFTFSTDSEVKNTTLNFTFRNNSVWGYKGNGTVITCCNPRTIVFEDNVLDLNLSAAVYLFNIIYPYSQLSAETSYAGGNICNNSGSYVSGVDFANGESLKSRFAIPNPNRFTYGIPPFLQVEASVGWLRSDPAVVGEAGCTYETKLWRSWAGDSGGNSESYGEGHGSDEFGWQ